MAESQKNRAIAAELVARACRDGAFRQQFIADPKALLIAAGAEIAADVEILALESTQTLRYIILPALGGDAGELTEAQLAAIAGGGGSTGTTPGSEIVSVQTTEVSAEAQAMATQTVFGMAADIAMVTVTVTV